MTSSRASTRAAVASALALALAARLMMQKSEHEATVSALREALEGERARADACEGTRRSWWRASERSGGAGGGREGKRAETRSGGVF